MMVNFVAVAAMIFTVNVLTFTAILFYRNRVTATEGNGNDVWMVAPLTRDEGFISTIVTMASTKLGFTLSCVPNMKARKQCDELAKVVGKKGLHYVELLIGDDKMLLGSYCTSNLKVLPHHIKHVCNYQFCTDETCEPLYVFDISVRDGTADEMCRTIAFSFPDTGPVVHKSSKCDPESQEPDKDSVMQECKENKGRIPTPEQNTWRIVKEDLDSLCKVVDMDHP